MKSYLSNIMIGLLLFSCVVSAQNINMERLPGETTDMTLSFQKPSYPFSDNLTTLSGLYKLEANIPVSRKVNMIIKLPYVTMKAKKSFYGKSEKSGLGNLELGIQRKFGYSGKSALTLALTIPSVNDEISSLGMYGDFYDAFAYVPRAISLHANYSHATNLGKVFFVGGEIGSTLLIPTEGDTPNGEVYVNYGLNAGYNIKGLFLNIEFTGRTLVTEDEYSFSDRTFTNLGIGAGWHLGDFTPAMFYKFYLNDGLSDIIDGVFGLRLSYSI